MQHEVCHIINEKEPGGGGGGASRNEQPARKGKSYCETQKMKTQTGSQSAFNMQQSWRNACVRPVFSEMKTKMKMKIKPKPKNHGTRANKAGTEPASSYLFGNFAMLFIVLGMAAALFAFGHCPSLPIPNLPTVIHHPPSALPHRSSPNSHTAPLPPTHSPNRHATGPHPNQPAPDLRHRCVFECGGVVAKRSMEQF